MQPFCCSECIATVASENGRARRSRRVMLGLAACSMRYVIELCTEMLAATEGKDGLLHGGGRQARAYGEELEECDVDASARGRGDASDKRDVDLDAREDARVARQLVCSGVVDRAAANARLD